MKEHPADCPGCADCFYDDSVEASEQRQQEKQQHEVEQTEQLEGAGLIVLPSGANAIL
jgi:hypothetical protein